LRGSEAQTVIVSGEYRNPVSRPPRDDGGPMLRIGLRSFASQNSTLSCGMGF
jgi:hypothetical protein